MYIVGTAGHVDHGKTALVKALTGTDTDRLPEEKRRGLTIELGFALLEGPEPVGIIDVPGHERFIRNMVSGTWALHCALLTVASDDGWMKQTTDHAHVLRGMGTPAVIVVITKADLADEKRICSVREDALQRCRSIFGYLPDSVVVSTLDHTGIDQCRSAVFSALKKPDRRRFPPCLYIDRSFTVQGAGTVVTGSLAGGPLRTGDQAVLLPGKETVKIRSLQNHSRTVTCAEPSVRTAVNLHKIKESLPLKGMCLTTRPGEFFLRKTFIAVLHGMTDSESPHVRNHQEAEMLYGTRHGRCTVHAVKNGNEGNTLTAMITCREEEAVFWGQRMILMRPGGSDILAWGQVLWPGNITSKEKKSLGGLMAVHQGLPDEISSYAHLRLAVRSYSYMGSEQNESLSLLGKTYIPVGSWYMEQALFDASVNQVISLASRPGGVMQSSLQGALQLPEAFIRSLMKLLTEEGKTEKQKHVYRTAAAEQDLSSQEALFLQKVEHAGIRGFEVRQIEPSEREIVGMLARDGHLMILESTNIYSTKTYQSIALRILFPARKPFPSLTT